MATQDEIKAVELIKSIDKIQRVDYERREEIAVKIDGPFSETLVYSDGLPSEEIRDRYKEALSNLNMLGGDERGGRLGTHYSNMIALLS